MPALPVPPNVNDRTSLQPGTLSIPSIAQSSTATLTLTFGTDGNQYNGVWVDFNQNGIFETSEYFTSGTNAGGSGTATVSIIVPASATLGQTRLRIRGGDDSQPSSGQSCGASNSSYGSAADYYVNITASVACAGTPGTPTATGPANACSGVAFALNATGLPPVGTTGITYQWQSSPAGAGTFANITGATTVPYNATQTAATDYQLLITCSNSGPYRYLASIKRWYEYLY